MRLTFTKDKPTRTVLLDEEGKPFFKVETPDSLGNHATKITRESDKNQTGWPGPNVTQVIWSSPVSPEIRLNGKQVDVADFMPQVSPDGARAFVTSEGHKYVWRAKDTELTLEDESGSIIAQYVPRIPSSSFNPFSRAEKAVLEVAPSGEPLIETILATFICMEMQRRGRTEYAGSIRANASAGVPIGFTPVLASST